MYRMGAIYWFYKLDRKKVTCHGAGICRSYLALTVHSFISSLVQEDTGKLGQTYFIHLNNSFDIR